jgi:Toprim-like/Protein of unknown function (DUF3991)
MDEELERFKRDIKLHEYAASLGYELDTKESSRKELVLRRSADKISIRKDMDGHYVYYSFRDPADHGTVLDFVMRRQGKNFGEARKILRTYVGMSRFPSLPVYEHLEPSARFDRKAVQAAWDAAKDLRWHDYLERERALPRRLLLSPRFRGLRVDARSNVLFAHYDDQGLCGFEKRNRTYKGFADLGEKGLWVSACAAEDGALVIGESAIDCISHACLFRSPARYASIAGGMSEKQPALIAAAIAALPRGAEVICITHDDPDGDRYADAIREVSLAGRFRIHRPSGVKDWNDVLTSERGRLSFPGQEGGEIFE